VVWEFDVNEQRVTAVSDSSTRVLGYTPEQWLASPALWRDAQHPEDLGHTQRIQAALAERPRARRSWSTA